MTKQKPNLRETILRTVFFFIAWFFIAAIISYFTLPDGILRSSNEAKDVSEQSSFLAFVFSIVIRNLIPAIGLCIGCLAAIRIRNCNYPFAYLGLFTMFTINGVTLGTWSFSVTHEAVPGLFPRLLRTFDLLHRAGLWEMVGQKTSNLQKVKYSVSSVDFCFWWLPPLWKAMQSLQECSLVFPLLSVPLMLILSYLRRSAAKRCRWSVAAREVAQLLICWTE